MVRRWEPALLVLADAAALTLAWGLYYLVRVPSGLIASHMAPRAFVVPMLVVTTVWLVWFWLFGLYRPWYTRSRLDELLLVARAVTIGIAGLGLVILIDDQTERAQADLRVVIVLYWAILLGCLWLARLLSHGFQRRLLLHGVGREKALIVGTGERAWELWHSLSLDPALGLDVAGFVRTGAVAEADSSWRTAGRGSSDEPEPLGGLADLPTLIDSRGISQVLIACSTAEPEPLRAVLAAGRTRPKLTLQIVPDLYDLVTGQVRLAQLHGFPLIQVSPLLWVPWQKAIKRGLDLAVSTGGLVLGAPVWAALAVAIRLGSPGPILYRQTRVGRGGLPFTLLKFRSMVADAEQLSGPVWATEADPRLTRLGSWMRRYRFDEVPQLLNILRGDMSLVGPRPERPYFVEKLTAEIPLYVRRLRVRPGLTGWAQVRASYDTSLDDVRQKILYDFFYIENLSLRLDLLILIRTLGTVLAGRGR